MRMTLLAVATAAAVFASIASAYADQQIDCTVVTRANLAQCVIQNSQNGSHDG
jgi:hypothetical protein